MAIDKLKLAQMHFDTDDIQTVDKNKGIFSYGGWVFEVFSFEEMIDRYVKKALHELPILFKEDETNITKFLHVCSQDTKEYKALFLAEYQKNHSKAILKTINSFYKKLFLHKNETHYNFIMNMALHFKGYSYTQEYNFPDEYGYYFRNIDTHKKYKIILEYNNETVFTCDTWQELLKYLKIYQCDVEEVVENYIEYKHKFRKHTKTNIADYVKIVSNITESLSKLPNQNDDMVFMWINKNDKIPHFTSYNRIDYKTVSNLVKEIDLNYTLKLIIE